ncbi:hypothetical protein MMC20_001817 [Loxospora ochrophaea]|nr:hypothetical protein [Loxospora ochrophaea]
MLFSKAELLLALLLSPLIGLSAGAPADLEDRKFPTIPAALLGLTIGPAAPASTGFASTTTASLLPTSSSTGRTKCSQAECPKFCGPSNSTEKRSAIGREDEELRLRKRFYDRSNPDTFTANLLKQDYSRNICPDTPKKNSYIWKDLSRQRLNYAAALEGLSGCTTIFIASSNGVFSSHIWEVDAVNDPPRDLQPNNYVATLQDLSNALRPHQESLEGGQAFLIVPVDPDNINNFAYGDAIVTAISDAIGGAIGLQASITTYVPLDFGDETNELGTNRRGTASFEFDPAYTVGDKTSKAYRVISEGYVLSLKTDL